jgi:hypothetical protein
MRSSSVSEVLSSMFWFMVFALVKKKPPGFWRWRFFWDPLG